MATATKQKAQMVAELAKLAQAVILEDDVDKPSPRLNDLERRIFNAIGTGRVVAKTIAVAVGRENSGSFLEHLTLLTRLGFLENEKGKEGGYSIHPFWLHLADDDESSAT